MNYRRLLLACAAALAITGPAPAQSPKLVVNGLTANDNSTVIHSKANETTTLELSGTPGAAFALLLSIRSNGAPNGFFLAPLATPGLFVPIHPVVDGIGSGTIALALGLPIGFILPDVPSPAVVFGPSGTLVLTGRMPEQLVLVDLASLQPLVLPLMTAPGSPTVEFFLQAVEKKGSQFSVGNGVRIVFEPLTFPGSVATAVAFDVASAAAANAIGSKNAFGEVTSQDFAGGPTASAVAAPDFLAAAGALDVWRIELAGIQSLFLASNPANAPIAGNPFDPDAPATYGLVQSLASGVDFAANTRPARDNEDPQYPSIALPGGRRLFHWRDATVPGAPRFGFGELHAASGIARNLTPAALGVFTSTASGPSPWEVEVGVTPDGNRALAVLDGPPGAADRLFLLALEPNGTFSNGLPAIEVPLPVSAAVARVFEESFTFVRADDGAWVALFATTDVTSTLSSVMPNRMFAVALDGVSAPVQLVPGGAFPGVLRVDRQPAVSRDARVACFIVSTTSGGTDEDVLAFRASSATQHTLVDCTAFPAPRTLLEWYDATDGQGGPVALAADGSRVAFAWRQGTSDRPAVARTDGSNAGSLVPLVKDLSESGPFDIVDFANCRDLALAAIDGANAVSFFQGLAFAGVQPDRMDLFGVDLATSVPQNLTRTLAGGGTFGPWNPTGDLTTTRPTVESGGTLPSPDGNWRYFFRERRGLAFSGPDVFNLVAARLAPTFPGGPPSFEIVNVTGAEFEAFPGSGPPAASTPDLVGAGSLAVDADARYSRLRRIVADHPFGDHFVFTLRRAVPAGQANPNADQLLLVSGNAPAPALVVTDFPSQPAAPQPTRPRLTDVVVETASPRLAFAFDPDGSGPLRQDAFVATLLPAPSVANVTASGFSRVIKAGSLHFTPTKPSGLLYVAGSAAADSPFTDGIQVPPHGAPNPIDANVLFHRFELGTTLPAATFEVLQAIPAGAIRAIHPWSVRSP